ncbi:MAG TPA: nicotinate-nucleotide adenylyltransferase [Pyrinomonadaceae bacterium]|nr:nicotinate-nucleotide adenylyltransferase [Pyrinomonadaceae bacterium]
MERRKRTAIYGGTFDPVHSGHLEVAKRVASLFELDEVLFVPAQLAPHKQAREVTSAMHRYAMLALATQNEPQLLVSMFEIENSDVGYTVETLAHFQMTLGGSVELFFLMGADSWSEITTWREWEHVLTMTSHIVVTRPGFPFSATHVGPTLANRVIDLRGQGRADILGTLDTAENRIYVTDAAVIDVSATEIRGAVQERRYEQLETLVPGAVADYIKKYGLYRELNET